MHRVLACALVAVAVVGGLWGAAARADGSGYHRYVGNLHSHTSYSDGMGTPAEAFAYARDQADIDFLAVTDHHNALTAAEYADIRAQAEAFSQSGVFVAIAGQEWTGEEYDHCTVLDADHVFTTPPYEYDALYQEILASGGTATFAHPHEGMFNAWAYSAVGDVGINSVEVRNEQEHLVYAEILNKGWKVGADGSQDNHSANWGNGLTWTVVLACSLTKAEVIGACRNLRTYSTNDRDLEINFESAGHLMGDAFSDSGSIDFAVDCRHPGAADSVLRVELYENGLRVAWLETRTDSCLWCPEITPRNGENNYFIRVNQEGCKRSFTSPIWVTCSTPRPSTPALCTPDLNEVVTTLSPDFSWHPSDQAATYTLEYSTSPAFDPGPSTVTVAGIEDTCYALGRNLADGRFYFWRVWATNAAGDGLDSGVGRFSVSVGVFLLESEARLTSDAGQDAQGALLQASGGLWFAWCSDRDGDYEIYGKTSPDGGETWSEEACLSQDTHKDIAPSLAETTDGDLWLVWSSRRTIGGYEIYYSVFDGAEWSAKTRLTDDPGADTGPCVAQTPDGLVWVAWSSDRWDANAEICCQTFDGTNWSATYRLTADSGADLTPALVSMGDGTLWAVWASDRGGHFEIYYKVFDGVSWSEDMMLAATSDDAGSPTVVRASDGEIWLAYCKANGIFYKMFVGGQWSDEARLYSGVLMDCDPSLAQTDDGRVWLAYASTRDGNPDVYAQQTNGSVTSGSQPRGGDVPTPGFVLCLPRPNPFSSETLIRYRLPGKTGVDLAIYSVLGQRIRTLAAAGLEAGEHVATWDGRSQSGEQVPGGVYFCHLSAGKIRLTQKVLLLR